MRGIKYLALAKNVCCSLSLVFCVVPVNVGNPLTVDAVDNTADAAYRRGGCAVDAWCIGLYGTRCMLCCRQDRI